MIWKIGPLRGRDLIMTFLEALWFAFPLKIDTYATGDPTAPDGEIIAAVLLASCMDADECLLKRIFCQLLIAAAHANAEGKNTTVPSLVDLNKRLLIASLKSLH